MSRERIAIAVGVLAVAIALGGLGRHLLLQWVFVQIGPAPLPAIGAIEGLPDARASTCGGCHPEQFREWQRSRMGQSMSDPVFLADYRAQGEPFVCLRCHAPLVEQQPVRVDGLASIRPLVGVGEPNPDFDPALQQEGVSCVACHLRQGALVGPIADPSAPHRTVYDPGFGEPELCARCHQLEAPPLSRLQRPLPDTHGENARWRAQTGRTEGCVDCHMPPVERPAAAGGPIRPGRSHRFPGRSDPALLRGAVELGEVRATDSGVVFSIENRCGHGLPTAEPSRALVIRAEDAAGAEVGRVVLARVIPLPKYLDLEDSSLRPGETRQIALPTTGPAAEIRVWLEPLRFVPAGVSPEQVTQFGDPVELARRPVSGG